MLSLASKVMSVFSRSHKHVPKFTFKHFIGFMPKGIHKKTKKQDIVKYFLE